MLSESDLLPRTISDILSRWPQTIPVFLHYHMGCVGCVMNSFDTLQESVLIYGLRTSPFINELSAAIASNHPDYAKSHS